MEYYNEHEHEPNPAPADEEDALGRCGDKNRD